ncbi:uncharacterized protein Ecym_3381 [Eremothecium cymbalariae DBVPG|uniref:Aldehyde dehydrogenase domain-containing protein n=1 Tax=Eremothecium cymbalariae (strain CBS 270.75 / DBVPG 7215 / KCTC 17166 / NRRL Y-17582) TaxID=931890 RepID=G8JRU9_ERECY|nr:Hypothetical protein Ecym_3381 [Eremothecium cymbalariae DBVPG\
MSLFEEITIQQVGITYKQPLGLFINNEYTASSDGGKIQTINPATEEYITSFYAGTEEDADRAVVAAREAFENHWRKTSPKERGDLLYKLANIVEREKVLLAALETLDSGKPYHSNSLGDINEVIKVTRYFAGAADKFNQGNISSSNHDKYGYSLKVPYGVVAHVIPWNYPLLMACWKLQGCLAAGNCIVVKPAENTSLSLLYFAQLVKEAGFPPGVFNVVPGYGPVAGSRLALHPDVDKIGFTGSTAVGKKIMSMAGQSNLKDVTLECGGKTAAIVLDDAILEDAIDWLTLGIFFNSGQNCTANSRIYVQESIFDEFLSKFKENTFKNWKFGNNYDPFDPECTMGPLISKVQYDRVSGYLSHGKETEKLEAIELGVVKNGIGFFVPPTIFINVPQDSKLCKEEIFGPVAVISTFKNYDEAVALANDSDYGLASCIFTENVRKANQFVRDARSGTVYVNCSNEDDISLPFGGFKMSGIGRELGYAGMESYLQLKSVHMNIGNPSFL